MNDDILNIIDDLVRESCEIEDDPEYDVDANLFDLGFLDSVGAMVLIMQIEEMFDIEISQKDVTLYPMSTAREIAEVVALKTS